GGFAAPAVGGHATAYDSHTVAETWHRVWFDECGRLAHEGRGVWIRTVLEQSRNNVCNTSARSKHQRGLTIVRIAGIDVRSVSQQILNRGEHTNLRSSHQGRLASRIGAVGVGAGLQQQV